MLCYIKKNVFPGKYTVWILEFLKNFRLGLQKKNRKNVEKIKNYAFYYPIIVYLNMARHNII